MCEHVKSDVSRFFDSLHNNRHADFKALEREERAEEERQKKLRGGPKVKRFAVYLGDREYEGTYGEQLVGFVRGVSEADARNNIRLGLWDSVSHNPTPGYWLVEQSAVRS